MSDSSGPPPSKERRRRWGRGGGGGGRSAWTPVHDACGQVAASFSPEKAMDAVEMIVGAGDAAQALGMAFKRVGQTASDEVAWDPRVSEVYETFGDMLIRAVPAIRDTAAAVQRIEDEKIRRATEGDSREAMWDVDRHRGR